MVVEEVEEEVGLGTIAVVIFSDAGGVKWRTGGGRCRPGMEMERFLGTTTRRDGLAGGVHSCECGCGCGSDSSQPFTEAAGVVDGEDVDPQSVDSVRVDSVGDGGSA